jgi:hypothetical protein
MKGFEPSTFAMAHAGLYVLVAPVIVALAGGVVSAWLLLVRLAAGSAPG